MLSFISLTKTFLKMRVSSAVLYSNSWIQHFGVCLKMNNFVLFSEWFQYIQVRYSDLKFWFTECHCCRQCQFASLVISLFVTYYNVFSTGAWGQDPPSPPSISTSRVHDWPFRLLIDIPLLNPCTEYVVHHWKFHKINKNKRLCKFIPNLHKKEYMYLCRGLTRV